MEELRLKMLRSYCEPGRMSLFPLRQYMEKTSKHAKKISVVIPAYNEEWYVRFALKSLRKQTIARKDFEIIVVDNASTDRTSGVAKAYGADIVISEPRQGTNFARRAGYCASNGEIVAFLDADCIAPPRWLERIIKKLHQKKETHSAIAGTYQFSADFPEPFDFIVTVYNWIVLTTMNEVMGKLLKRGGVVIGGNFASFREHFEQVEIIDTSFTFFGDDANIARNFGQIAPIYFDPGLAVVSSARRFMRDGIIKTNWEYTKNYFKVMLGS